jgi:Leucine-rich repeat (LRR) protein
MERYSSETIDLNIQRARLNGWHELNLSQCRARATDLHLLANEPGVENLQVLDLQGSLLLGAGGLADCFGRFNGLCRLSLCQNLLNDPVSLAEWLAPLTLLRELDLSDNLLSDLAPLANVFGDMPYLVKLNVKGNSCGLPDELLATLDPASINLAILAKELESMRSIARQHLLLPIETSEAVSVTVAVASDRPCRTSEWAAN